MILRCGVRMRSMNKSPTRNLPVLTIEPIRPLMKLYFTNLAVILTCFLTFPSMALLHAESALHDFITVRGDQLMEGDKPFVSFPSTCPICK